MGGSESQPKANKQTPRRGGEVRQRAERANSRARQESQPTISPSGSPPRRPTVEELLAKVREGIVTTHAMLSAMSQEDSRSPMKGELERRLALLLSYEERLVLAQHQALDHVHPQPSAEKKRRLHPAVSQCPRILYTEEHSRSDEEEKRTCSICWVDYEVGDTVLILPCLHWVHGSCGEEWLLRKPQCPICQLDVVQSLRNCATFTD